MFENNHDENNTDTIDTTPDSICESDTLRSGKITA